MNNKIKLFLQTFGINKILTTLMVVLIISCPLIKYFLFSFDAHVILVLLLLEDENDISAWCQCYQSNIRQTVTNHNLLPY